MVPYMHLCTCETCTQQLQEQNKSCFGVPRARREYDAASVL